MKKMIAILSLSLLAASACSSEHTVPDADAMAAEASAEAKEEGAEIEEEAKEEIAEAAHAATTVDVVDTAVAAGEFTTLVAAVTAAELADDLKGEGPFTVFAPNDAAFKALPAGTVEELLKPANKAKLVSLLQYHVVPGKMVAADVKPGEVETLNGTKVAIKLAEDGSVLYGGSKVIATDIDATNGVIHVLEAVAMPPAGGAKADAAKPKTDAATAAKTEKN